MNPDRDADQTLAASDTDGGRSTDPATLGSGEVLAGRYELLELLGSGGMGTVYRAHDLELDEVVALKTLRADYLSAPGALVRFRRELKLARRVTHRSVARAYDLGEHKGERFLTMELIEGPSLERVLDEHGPLEFDELVRVGSAICEGLIAAHAAGVVHRDLKPDNVLLAGDRVVITDFGVARHLDAVDANEARATAVGGIVGTPAYMAPEQVEGNDVDARTDLYALGVVLFEAASGRLPFEGRSPLAIAAARLLHPAPPLGSARPDCSPALADLVARALARDRSERFGSATEMLAALQALRTMPSPQLPAPQPASHRPRTERRIAVVPLRNAGADEDLWIVEGLADDLIDSLSLADGIRVRARSPALGREEDLRSYGRRLDVELIIEGSARRRGDRVRTNLRLVSIDDGFQVWARRFDSSVAELLRIGDEAAQAIADVLAGARLEARHRATPPPEVVEYYLRAKRARSRMLGEALELMTQALALAPDNPNMLAAYAQFAAAELSFEAAGDPSVRQRAIEASQRALATAPELPETHLALARIHMVDEDVLAIQEALLARRLGPGMAEPDDLLGRLLTDCDLLIEARVHLERAVWIDPTPGQFTHVDLIRIDAFEGRWDQVIEKSERILAHNTNLGTLLALRMRMWGATELPVPPALVGVPESLQLMEALCRLPGQTGEVTPEWTAQVERLCTLQLPGSRALRLWRQIEAEGRLACGDVEGGMRAVAQSVEHGLRDLAWMRRCPLLASVRSDPRFVAFTETVEARVSPRIAAYREGARSFALGL